MLIAARKRVKCLEGERNRNRIPEKKKRLASSTQDDSKDYSKSPGRAVYIYNGERMCTVVN